jgi:hypothetical protein
MTTVSVENEQSARLLELYNEAAKALGRPLVKRFADRKTALKRVKAILAELPGKPLGGRGMDFNLPLKKPVKTLRQGTKRQAIFDALKKGATFEEVEAIVKKHDREKPPRSERTPEKLRAFTYEAIRLLHHYCGYGLEQRDGKIYVIAP